MKIKLLRVVFNVSVLLGILTGCSGGLPSSPTLAPPAATAVSTVSASVVPTIQGADLQTAILGKWEIVTGDVFGGGPGDTV